jgi:ribonuclease J
VTSAPEPAGIIDEVPAARLYKDGRGGEPHGAAAAGGYNGMVTVALALTDKGEMAAHPEVELIGIPDLNAEGDSMAEIAYDAVMATVESLPRARRATPTG